MNGKNFNLFLMDGEVTGSIKCTLSNWTGIAYKVPRNFLEKYKDRKDLKQCGVYFLFGKNKNEEDEVYVGQGVARKNGEGVLFRVTEHLKDDYDKGDGFYFNEAIMFTTQNDSFGPTDISYLENRFTNMAKETGRYIVKNNNDPNPGNVTEEKKSELEEFINYSEMVLGILGYKVFVPLIKKEEKKSLENNQEDLLLHLNNKSQKSNKEIKAFCKKTNEGFVLLEESMIEVEDGKAIPEPIKEQRKRCFERNEIVDGILKKQILFTSPSAAAAFVLGTNINGRTKWVNESGVTLKKLEEINNQ